MHIPLPHWGKKKPITELPDLSNLATKEDVKRIEARLDTAEKRRIWNSLSPYTQKRLIKRMNEKRAKNEK